MLEWQCGCRSCCFFRSGAVVLSCSSSSFCCTSFSWCSSCPHHCLYAGGVQSRVSLWDRSSDSKAPASRSLRRAWDNGRVTGGGETLSFCESHEETQRGQGTVKGRGCESEPLGLWTAERIEVPCWAFMPGLWDQTQLNTQKVNRDPRSLFFSHRVQHCVFALWWTGDLCGVVPCHSPSACWERFQLPQPIPDPGNSGECKDEWMKNTSRVYSTFFIHILYTSHKLGYYTSILSITSFKIYKNYSTYWQTIC